MTRYARAQGSKGSNKREEEEATPWSVMVRGIRGSGVVDRRREVAEKNPEDFDEADDIVDDDDDDDVDVKQDESEDDDDDEQENAGLSFVITLVIDLLTLYYKIHSRAVCNMLMYS
jgi:hypothetical protein